MQIDEIKTRLVWLIGLPKESHPPPEFFVHTDCTLGRIIRLFNSIGEFDISRSGYLQNHLTDTATKIDKGVLAVDGDTIDHLLN